MTIGCARAASVPGGVHGRAGPREPRPAHATLPLRAAPAAFPRAARASRRRPLGIDPEECFGKTAPGRSCSSPMTCSCGLCAAVPPPPLRWIPGELPASLRVKFPNQGGILRPRFGARDVLESVAVPEPSGISKRAHPALRADPCAGKDEYGSATRDGQGLERGMNSNVGHVCVASLGRIPARRVGAKLFY
jgi:hypothetical protein